MQRKLFLCASAIVESTEPIKPKDPGHTERKGHAAGGQDYDKCQKQPLRQFPKIVKEYTGNCHQGDVKGIGNEHGAKVKSRFRLKTCLAYRAVLVHRRKFLNPA